MATTGLGMAVTIGIIIVTVAALIFFIANAWYWSRIYFNNVETSPVTRSEAAWFFGLSVLFAVIFLAMMIYLIYVMATSGSTKVTRVATMSTMETSGCASGLCPLPDRINNLYQYS